MKRAKKTFKKRSNRYKIPKDATTPRKVIRYTQGDYDKRSQRKAMKKLNRKFIKKYGNKGREWTKLHKQYISCLEHFKLVTFLMSKLEEFKPYKYLNQDQVFVLAKLAKLMVRDAKRFDLELKKIYDAHKDKKGAATLEEIDEILGHAEAYFNFKEMFFAIVTPVYNHIVDLIALAEHNKKNYDKVMKEYQEKAKEAPVIQLPPNSFKV